MSENEAQARGTPHSPSSTSSPGDDARRPPHAHEPETCFAPQIAQLETFVGAGAPILFTLPAFPSTSLRSLQQLCTEIERLYQPGARMLICSDGTSSATSSGCPATTSPSTRWRCGR